MTTFNDGPILRQSVLSILRQTYENFELLVVDDGSDASTKKILSEFDDPRLVVLSQSNDGLSSARNRALHHAKGDYICFLDADDVRSPWAFAETVDVIATQSNPECVFVMGVYSGERTLLSPFLDEQHALAYTAYLANGGADDLASRKSWALAMEPQSANKYVARKLIERSILRFPNDHFYEDILFHAMIIANAQSVEILPATQHFTYFQRALRFQITAANDDKRFDIVGVAGVTLKLFEMHSEFHDEKQRGALMISLLRLVEWCDNCISLYHKYAFRVALRETMRDVDPVYFVISAEAPDPRNDRVRLLDYIESVIS